MKLINKFILVYLLIALVVFSIGGILSYYTFTDVVDQETDNELGSQTNQVTRLIEKGIPYSTINDHEINIKVVSDTFDIVKKRHFFDTMAYHWASQGIIHHRKMVSVRKINNVWYQLEIFNSLLEPEDTMAGTVKSTSLIYVLLVVITLLLSIFVSKWLLDPFNLSLKEIENFSIQKGHAILLPKTNTYEFNQFNEFIKKMTSRAIKDYSNLREFSENTAHEIRTPLAISSGKMDLLLQTKSLTEEQVSYITEAQNALNKVSKIQHSLSTLSKIENEEFSEMIHVNLSQLLAQLISEHEDIINLKNIQFSKEIQSNVTLTNDPTLLEMLLTNLLQNAIKYNVESNGFIKVKLTSKRFIITNSGTELSIPTEQLLERFKKNKQTGDSLGLGLAIVKNICLKSKYTLSYDYNPEDKTHQLSIDFKTSDLNQN